MSRSVTKLTPRLRFSATIAGGSLRVSQLQPSDRVFNLIPYAPSAHGAFVRSTWALGALRDGSRQARERLDVLLALPGSRAILAHAPSGRFSGWAAATSDALIFAYVLPVLRGRGLGTMLVRELGFDGVDAPIPLLFWTPSAQRIAAGRSRWIYHAVYGFENAA